MTGIDSYLRSQTTLNDEHIERIIAAATPRSLRRNEWLLQQGQICRHKTFVAKGLLRIYGTTNDGGEHILQFSQEGHWTVDAESYHRQNPSAFNISAVEPSQILLWTKTDFDQLLADIPQLAFFSQQLVQLNIYDNRQRLFTTLSATPEEKYSAFIRAYPDLLNRLPLHMIAAYLGLSLKTLTRIRHAQLHR
ncbi:Crp/Fnr family transcriptional regulator [Chitinophaga pendula]|uniref:Crp/Fnr family transcriptional regulator n=1 Tax=Chitinophaga TaxID=79328 RepID=UPI000BB0294C|nr:MULTISPECIES: Crp/Fnr family transcriptional regulator [Chitinophaga]ASZ13301.1 cyclic nucleotide-binding protein [Chitinophaga sp. MD30]UCJ09075.1 Crp/Fnr family transcriptional regulator [Chitinophaga pendula]